MKKEIYIQAKSLRDIIDRIEKDKNELEKMRNRDNDEEFNLLRQIAHEYVCATLARKEKDFDNL